MRKENDMREVFEEIDAINDVEHLREITYDRLSEISGLNEAKRIIEEHISRKIEEIDYINKKIKEHQ